MFSFKFLSHFIITKDHKVVFDTAERIKLHNANECKQCEKEDSLVRLPLTLNTHSILHYLHNVGNEITLVDALV